MVRAATESEGTDRMTKMPKLMAAAGAALVALLIAGAALAQPAAPHTFWGAAGDSVTIDGEPAPSGARIVAMADGEEVGSSNLGADGEWSVEVTGGTTGVTFMVNDVPVPDMTRDANAGGQTRLSMLAAVTPAMTGGDDSMDGDSMSDELEGDDSMDGDSMSDELEGDDSMDGDSMDEDPPSDSMDGMDGDDSGMMDDEDPPGDSMMEGEEGTVGGATGLPDNGSGGLADSSRGVSTAVYGGIAGALALIALVGGVAIRRRAQS